MCVYVRLDVVQAFFVPRGITLLHNGQMVKNRKDLAKKYGK